MTNGIFPDDWIKPGEFHVAMRGSLGIGPGGGGEWARFIPSGIDAANRRFRDALASIRRDAGLPPRYWEIPGPISRITFYGLPESIKPDRDGNFTISFGGQQEVVETWVCS